MSLCPWLQNKSCNETGSPHTDLFPLNNETLEVDIYKGVRLVVITSMLQDIQDAYNMVKEKTLTGQPEGIIIFIRLLV